METETLNCCVAPAVRVLLVGEIVTVTLAGGFNVTCADADFDASAWDTAVTVTRVWVGIDAGAVYRPALEMVPLAGLPPCTPSTCQVTAVFELFETVAVNCWVAPAVRAWLVGDIATEIPGGAGLTVTCAEADFEASDWDTAITVNTV